MKSVFICSIVIIFLIIPVEAQAFTAPTVPESGNAYIPEAETFGEGLLIILQDFIEILRPDLHDAALACLSLLAIVMLISLTQSLSENLKTTTQLAGTAAISASMLLSTNALIQLGAQTVTELTEYGKLLLPVMAAAMAAQGSITTSTAISAGTSGFAAFFGAAVSRWILPIIYIYLAFSIMAAAVGEDMLKKIKDLIKDIIAWFLKTIITAFISYIGITGAISGTTDAIALKAAKATISSAVPVVGGILSDASEAVLISVQMAKNAAGIYGIYALLAVCLEPFAQIGCHYLALRASAAVCGIFGSKSMVDLISDFTTAMGLLLAATGSVCLLLLIGTACFLKGVA